MASCGTGSSASNLSSIQPTDRARAPTRPAEGSSTARHLYLGKRDMWGAKGKAVLKDVSGTTAASLRY